MYNHQYVLNRVLSRILFLQYVINYNSNYDIDVDNAISIMNEHSVNVGDLWDFNTYDQEFYNRLVNYFNDNHESILCIIDNIKKIINLDSISYAILISGVVEFQVRDNKKHIISDYLKIADSYEISARLIHSTLQDIFNIISMDENCFILIIVICYSI